VWLAAGEGHKPAPLAPGRHTVEFAFKSDGPGFGIGGTGTITVDGVEAGKGTFEHTIPFALESSTFSLTHTLILFIFGSVCFVYPLIHPHMRAAADNRGMPP
jgi:hypothetical protein